MQTDERLRRLIDEYGIDATIEYQLIETQEAAERYQFAGSPTVLFDGVDPFEQKVRTVGLACRVYLTEAGASEGPSADQLRKALGMTAG